jgi:hypothetical protein
MDDVFSPHPIQVGEPMIDRILPQFPAVSSFIGGLSRTLDLGCMYPGIIQGDVVTPGEADARALRSDWGVVGAEIDSAIETAKTERPACDEE